MYTVGMDVYTVGMDVHGRMYTLGMDVHARDGAQSGGCRLAVGSSCRFAVAFFLQYSF